MNKDISYKGYTAQPSDYDCPDGDLAVSLNLLHEDGALRPLSAPSKLFNIGKDKRIFIHRAGAISNYIAYGVVSPTISWVGTESGGKFETARPISLPSGFGHIVSITAVRYILIVSTINNLFYIRFNANENQYVFLGTRLPQVSLDLALKLNFETENQYNLNLEFGSGTPGTGEDTTPDDMWDLVVTNSYRAATPASPEHGNANHDLLTENWPLNSSSGVSTGFIELPNIVIKPNIEYKLQWYIMIALVNTGIILYGHRKGSSEREQIMGIIRSQTTEYFLEQTKTFTEEYTNLSYKIYVRGYTNSSTLQTTGSVSLLSGIDNSETGSDTVSSYIKYTLESHNVIMASINKFVNEKATMKSKFIYPFFVRYAVQLYDGSYGYISSPILMVPNSGYVPAINFLKFNNEGQNRLLLSAFLADIQYRASQKIPDEWKDLFLGIDVFVSQPIWAYDQGKEYDGLTNEFKFYPTPDSISFGRSFIGAIETDPGTGYSRRNLADYVNRYASTSGTNTGYVKIAPRSQDDIMEDIETTSNFYKIASIGIEDINKSISQFISIDLEKEVLSGLVAREPLQDSSLQYEGFKKGYLKDYNNRLHICHSEVILRSPELLNRCFNYLSDDWANTCSVYVVLATEDGPKMVQVSAKGSIDSPWFFYPDSRAYKAIFAYKEPTDYRPLMFVEVELTRHTMLNGAFWHSRSFANNLVFGSGSLPEMPSSNSLPALSTIYVSEANNPFVFQAVNAVAVGAQEVMAVSTAAKALSQGQFGQFPLYAFSTEGVWALSPSFTGGYTSVQPIVRDETIDIQSITQIDSAVLFASKRGIMLLSGSRADCITDSINTEYPFDPTTLAGFNKLHRLLGGTHTGIYDFDSSGMNKAPDILEPGGWDELINPCSCFPIAPFSRFLDNCRMIYDYVHQHIIVYSPSQDYAYVFSLKSKLWGMIYSNIESHFNSYPEAHAIDDQGNLVTYSDRPDSKVKGLFLTRPLKLDTSDIHKTIDTVIQRGFFRRGNVNTVLYGSRDLINWHLVWSSKDHYLRGFSGSPYKYFRIGGIANLQPNESIHSASVQFNLKFTNKPR